MIDRSKCAAPTVGPTGELVPCGKPATVRAPPESTYTWAYCRDHADRKRLLLEVQVRLDMAAGETAVEKRLELDALEQAMEGA